MRIVFQRRGSCGNRLRVSLTLKFDAQILAACPGVVLNRSAAKVFVGNGRVTPGGLRRQGSPKSGSDVRKQLLDAH